jgi:hypothetical protein
VGGTNTTTQSQYAASTTKNTTEKVVYVATAEDVIWYTDSGILYVQRVGDQGRETKNYT